MPKIILGARVVLGLVFFIAGVIGVLNLAKLPTTTASAETFLASLKATGYLYKTINGIGVVCGALLILGLFVPLALTLLAPIVVNILLYNLFLDPAGLPVSVAVLAVELFLVFCYRSAFLSLLDMKPMPNL